MVLGVLYNVTGNYTEALLAHLGFSSGSGSSGATCHALAQWDAARVGMARPHDICIASTPLVVLFPKARVEK